MSMFRTEFFQPLDDRFREMLSSSAPDSMAAQVTVHSMDKGLPGTDGVSLAIIGVPEFRGSSQQKRFDKGTDAVREHFYRLKRHEGTVRIIDLGDLIPGYTLDDTAFALTEIIGELMQQGVLPVIIGGSQDLTLYCYRAYKSFNRLINICGVDSRFDLGLPEDVLSSDTWLGKLVLEQPNYLFNFSNLGYQTYFVGRQSVDLMNKLFFDAYRSGLVRTDITEAEPVIRAADLLTFDLSAIRQGDAPGTTFPSPNGFTGEEACQLMMYAGLNDRLTALGIFEFDPANDRQGQTAHLLAQMLWYFIEGVNQRKNDFPMPNHTGFVTYRVALSSLQEELVFLRHAISGRWWMEIPDRHRHKHLARYNYLPCSYADYQQACKNELPERLWQALQKI